MHADFLSRLVDCDDWSVTDTVFRNLDEKWGPHTVDRFSSHYNSKCERFNSRWWVPGTEGINCLNQVWSGEVNWLVPPPAQVVTCIRKMESDKCVGTLILPEWKSAAFWPLLVTEEGAYRDFIKSVYVLPCSGSIKQGRGNNGMFGKDPLAFRMIALRCDCK